MKANERDAQHNDTQDNVLIYDTQYTRHSASKNTTTMLSVIIMNAVMLSAALVRVEAPFRSSFPFKV